MKKITIIISLLTFITFSGCQKDFITLDPMARLTPAYLKTAEGAQQGLTACYDILQSEATWGHIQWAIGDVGSDDSYAGGQNKCCTDQPAMQDIDQFRINANNQYTRIWWKNLYNGIYRCNLVTAYVKDGDFDETLKKRYIAEARFLKALYFFNLTVTYGPIPVFEEMLTPENYTMGQSSWGETWDLIEKLLNEAIPDLPEKSKYASTDMGRATKGAAKALLVKAYIFQSSYAKYGTSGMYNGVTGNKWDKALALAEEIINSSEYSLLTSSTTNYLDYYNTYKSVFGLNNKNNKESIFEVQSTKDANSTYTSPDDKDFNWPVNEGNKLGIYQMCREYKEKIIKNGIITWKITKKGIGWGFNCPSVELWNEYEFSKINGNDTLWDPRRTATIATDKDSFQWKPSGTVLKTLFYCNEQSYSGLSARKYFVEYEFWNSEFKEGMMQPVNIKIIRYADVLLWAAEAAYETGDPDKAKFYLKQVRNRAGLSEYPDAALYPQYQDVKAAIYHERRVELALEGHRFFDIVRQGRAYDLCKGIWDGFKKNKNERLPIPPTDIIYSGGNLKQNPNY